jgi:glycosyltransferase involved in cell wall biosynthesis
MPSLSEQCRPEFGAGGQKTVPVPGNCELADPLANGSGTAGEPLRILQILRAPIGGLFRHVCDLSTGLSQRGHSLGVLCDASAASSREEAQLAELSRQCSLGIHRMPLRRQPGLGDLVAAKRAYAVISSVKPDIVHGHGAKGGAYARLAGAAQKKAGRHLRIFYTPHGGSMHYNARSPAGRLFLGLEKLMSALTDGLIFESAFGLETYRSKAGRFSCPASVIYNGLHPEEFSDCLSGGAPADFMFAGELRHLKGVELLLRAVAALSKTREVTIAIAGRGPDEKRFRHLTDELGLARQVVFHGELPVRQALSLGRCLVVPSLAESLPYIVLEGAAAGVPMILTNVGGIPEIVAGVEIELLEPGAVAPLAEEMQRFLLSPGLFRNRANQLKQVTRQRFSAGRMVDEIENFYYRALKNEQQCSGQIAI